MRAIKLTAQVSPEHTLSLQLPADVPPGMAEVIVLYSEASATGRPRSLEEFMQHLEEADIPRRTKEDIDHYLEEERNSWERDDVRDLPR
jgi:hypothetical protein